MELGAGANFQFNCTFPSFYFFTLFEGFENFNRSDDNLYFPSVLASEGPPDKVQIFLKKLQKCGRSSNLFPLFEKFESGKIVQFLSSSGRKGFSRDNFIDSLWPAAVLFET